MHTNIQNTIQYFRNTPFTDTQNTKSTTQGVRCYSWGSAHCIFELLWKIVNIPYQHDQHNNFKFFCQNLISWLHVVFVISSRKVFSPKRRSQSTGWDVTSSGCASKCTAEKKLRCAAFGMKGSRKRPARAHTGGKHPSSIFLHSSEYFSTRTQVTNTNKYSSSVLGSHCLLWYLNNMEYCKAHRLIVAPWASIFVGKCKISILDLPEPFIQPDLLSDAQGDSLTCSRNIDFFSGCQWTL